MSRCNRRAVLRGGVALAAGLAASQSAAENAVTPKLAQLYGPSAAVTGLAISPDGKSMASLSLGTIRIWDLVERVERHTLKWVGHGFAGATPLAFSPDGKLLAHGDEIYDLTTNQARVRLRKKTDPTPEIFTPDSVTFSPDGKTLATVGGELYHFQLKLWDVATGDWKQTLVEWSSGTCFLHSAVFSPDGSQLAADVNGDVRVWDAKSGKPLHLLKGPGGLTMDQVLFSPDGETLTATGYEVDGQKNGTSRVLAFWNASTGAPRKPVPLGRPDEGVGPRSLSYSPDGTLLALCDGRVRLYHPEDGSLAGSLPEHVAASKVAFFPGKDRRLAVGQRDGLTSVWTF